MLLAVWPISLTGSAIAKETTVASLETRYARVAIYVPIAYIASVGQAAGTLEVFA
jgi:hypothetical protein